MAIASGTCGTCKWTIADDGSMTIGAGTLHAPWLPGIFSCNWPWGNHVKDIKSCTIASGVIVGDQEALMGGYDGDPTLAYMFYGCSEMTNLKFQGTFDTSRVVSFYNMLYGCSSLTAIDLSPIDSRKAKTMYLMLGGCDMLTSIIFGSLFDTSALEDTSGTGFLGYGFYSARNADSGLLVNTDEVFRTLSKEQHQGTWIRNSVSVTFSASVIRTEGGSADEDGEDATITVTWLTGTDTDIRNISIYMKKTDVTSYPVDPVKAEALSGNSGTTEITVEDIGNDAYDFKVEFYDGVNTYIAFPSVASNIILVTIDEDGIPSCHNPSGTFGSIFDLIYPVGSIYMSVNAASPAVLFGGTWEQIQNRFLLAAGSSYAAGSTGGSADASLVAHTHSVSGTAASNGAHTHSMNKLWSNGSGSSTAYTMQSSRTLMTRSTASAGAHTHSVTGTAASNGVAAAGKNMPPYLTVYMWKRTA